MGSEIEAYFLGFMVEGLGYRVYLQDDGGEERDELVAVDGLPCRTLGAGAQGFGAKV